MAAGVRGHVTHARLENSESPCSCDLTVHRSDARRRIGRRRGGGGGAGRACSSCPCRDTASAAASAAFAAGAAGAAVGAAVGASGAAAAATAAGVGAADTNGGGGGGGDTCSPTPVSLVKARWLELQMWYKPRVPCDARNNTRTPRRSIGRTRAPALTLIAVDSRPCRLASRTPPRLTRDKNNTITDETKNEPKAHNQGTNKMNKTNEMNERLKNIPGIYIYSCRNTARERSNEQTKKKH